MCQQTKKSGGGEKTELKPQDVEVKVWTEIFSGDEG
jgi:hypothetical protein